MNELFAYFDRETGKIHNARKGSLIYLHEEGHKVHNKTFQKYGPVIHTVAVLGVFSFTLFESREFIYKLFVLPYLGYVFADELIAWGYAFVKYFNLR